MDSYPAQLSLVCKSVHSPECVERGVPRTSRVGDLGSSRLHLCRFGLPFVNSFDLPPGPYWVASLQSGLRRSASAGFGADATSSTGPSTKPLPLARGLMGDDAPWAYSPVANLADDDATTPVAAKHEPLARRQHSHAHHIGRLAVVGGRRGARAGADVGALRAASFRRSHVVVRKPRSWSAMAGAPPTADAPFDLPILRQARQRPSRTR